MSNYVLRIPKTPIFKKEKTLGSFNLNFFYNLSRIQNVIYGCDDF